MTISRRTILTGVAAVGTAGHAVARPADPHYRRAQFVRHPTVLVLAADGRKVLGDTQRPITGRYFTAREGRAYRWQQICLPVPTLGRAPEHYQAYDLIHADGATFILAAVAVTLEPDDLERFIASGEFGPPPAWLHEVHLPPVRAHHEVGLVA